MLMNETEEERPLSLVQEESESLHSRSGTPTNRNVQQSYFSHGQEETKIVDVNTRSRSREGKTPSPEHVVVKQNSPPRSSGNHAVKRVNAPRDMRTLSVRNGEAVEGVYDEYSI